MRFYHITDDYIKFLRQYDNSVEENKQNSRPYIGVVLQIEDIKYYVPLTSPKAKHRQMKNGKDFRKIKGGEYGAINFNNMIPVPDSALIGIDFAKELDMKYRILLQNQYEAINNDIIGITSTATKLRQLVLADDESLSQHDLRVKSRCCNLKLLEDVYYKFNGTLE